MLGQLGCWQTRWQQKQPTGEMPSTIAKPTMAKLEPIRRIEMSSKQLFL